MNQENDASYKLLFSAPELVPKVPGVVSEYLPQLKYCLIGENNYSTVGWIERSETHANHDGFRDALPILRAATGVM